MSGSLISKLIRNGFSRPVAKLLGNLVSTEDIADVVRSETDGVTGGISVLWSGSQAEYDAIAVKDNSTLYVIV